MGPGKVQVRLGWQDPKAYPTVWRQIYKTQTKLLNITNSHAPGALSLTETLTLSYKEKLISTKLKLIFSPEAGRRRRKWRLLTPRKIRSSGRGQSLERQRLF